MRSVLTCETKIGVCGACYGRDLARGTSVNVGEAVGVIAAQSIGEPGTQLTMRTFHIGGAAQRGAEQSSIEAVIDGKVKLQDASLIEVSKGQYIVMNRHTQLLLLDAQGRERSNYRLSYGAKLLVKDGAKVEAGQRMVEWDPYTLPIVSEVAGVVDYVDLTDGVSMREVTDDSTGITSREVIDWKAQAKGKDLRPRLTMRDASGDVIILANGHEARYFLSPSSILSAENGAKVKAGDVLARIPRESSKTRDITGGLPRVAELFEARLPKDAAIISAVDGRVEFGAEYKNKQKIRIIPTDDSLEPVDYMVPKGKALAVRDNDSVRKGEALLEGSQVPHDILKVLGVEKLAEYLINEIQDVYRLQGVKINDKHIEVIVRQMLQKIEVRSAGGTTLLVNEQVDREEFAAANAAARKEGAEEATGQPVLLGITKASLQTRSFISAASFQETTRVLTEAAVSGKEDMLNGLKENVIVGRLIPAGTGSVMAKMRNIAQSRDKQLEKEQQRERDRLAAEAAAAAEAEAIEAAKAAASLSPPAESPAEASEQ